jgi:hypothetical protein
MTDVPYVGIRSLLAHVLDEERVNIQPMCEDTHPTTATVPREGMLEGC